MYIRTKDRVYDTNKHHYEIEIDVLYEIVWDDPYTEYGVNGKYSRGKVIAQSENLEELCDEFVGVDNTCENGHQLLRAVPYKCANFWNGGVYGAIWTDTGLIYVVKITENGNLELV